MDIVRRLCENSERQLELMGISLEGQARKIEK